MERFFLNLKMERVWQRDYANHAEAIHDIADYVVGFYISTRLHSTLGNLSPNAFERESTSKKSIALSEITDHNRLLKVASGRSPPRQSRYQPPLPGSPLNGPVNSGVIHPP